MVQVEIEFPPRMLEEWCWQLREADDWERLSDALADVAFVTFVWVGKPSSSK